MPRPPIAKKATKIAQILLDPVVIVPERELWLYKNPTALASVMQGLRDAAGGEVHHLGSFADHV